MRLRYGAGPHATGTSEATGPSRQRGPVPGQRAGTFGRREEDLVRPVVDRTGAQIWVPEEDLFWHDIVLWPREGTHRVSRVAPVGMLTPAADPAPRRVAGDRAASG
jgi:hypothetical protein